MPATRVTRRSAAMAAEASDEEPVERLGVRDPVLTRPRSEVRRVLGGHDQLSALVDGLLGQLAHPREGWPPVQRRGAHCATAS